jgi:hypothetical protein
MARYVFQDAFERFIVALDDARLLYDETGRVNFGKRGGLVVESRAMYRAIAVISIAAWEDFNEQLIGAGYDYLKKTAAKPVPAELEKWFPPDRLQAPKSHHVRKLYWAYFGLDPMLSWWFSFTARGHEIGIDSDRYVWFDEPSHLKKRTRRGTAAADWLDALVQLRHATAHQDPTAYKNLELGVATPKRGGEWGVRRYNAQNAIVVVTQLALCTIQALAQHLDVPGELRFLSPLHSWKFSQSKVNDLPQWPGGTS